MPTESPESDAPDGDGREAAEPPKTANARRVARHKRKLAVLGLRQLNVQVPVEAHGLLKALAQRLRQGEDPSVALFDLVAEQNAQPEPSAFDRRIAPRPPLERSELKDRAGNGTDEQLRADARLGAYIREILKRGGWRATLIRNLLK